MAINPYDILRKNVQKIIQHAQTVGPLCDMFKVEVTDDGECHFSKLGRVNGRRSETCIISMYPIGIGGVDKENVIKQIRLLEDEDNKNYEELKSSGMTQIDNWRNW